MMEGHTPIGAGSCQEALAAAEVEPFDLYLLDVGLPDGDGCDLLRQLAEKHTAPGVAITGFGFPEERERAEAAGFCHVLVKPFMLEDLKAAIERCMEDADMAKPAPRA